MNPNNCRLTGLHLPIEPRTANSGFLLICRFCKKNVDANGKLIIKGSKEFDKDKLYAHLVKFYIIKGYSKERSNAIAQKIVTEQIERHKTK